MNEDVVRKMTLPNGTGVCVLIPTKWVRRHFGSKRGPVELVIRDDEIVIRPVKEKQKN